MTGGQPEPTPGGAPPRPPVNRIPGAAAVAALVLAVAVGGGGWVAVKAMSGGDLWMTAPGATNIGAASTGEAEPAGADTATEPASAAQSATQSAAQSTTMPTAAGTPPAATSGMAMSPGAATAGAPDVAAPPAPGPMATMAAGPVGMGLPSSPDGDLVPGPVVDDAAPAVQQIHLVVNPPPLFGVQNPAGDTVDAFVPANFSVKVGVPVRVTVTTYDDAAHTFTSAGLGINQMIGGGSQDHPADVTFTFTPTRTGTFTWFCRTDCDPWAMATVGYMRGIVTVVS